MHADLLEGGGFWQCLPGPELTAVAELAQRLLGSDMSAFSVLDRDWQWLTAKCGIDGDRMPREHGFCGRVVDTNAVLLLPDAAADPDYRDHPMVAGEPHVGAYAGMPVVMHNEDGHDVVVGSLCVVYRRARAFDPDAVEQLRKLAAIAAALVSSRLTALELADLAAQRQDDLQRLARIHRQLGQAERIAGMGSWRLDLADNSIHWSDQVYAIHDLPMTQVPPLESAMSFYPGRSRTTLTDALDLAIRQGRPFDEEVDFVSATGTAKRVRSMGEVEVQNGTPVALIGVFQDVTCRYEMEQALRRSASTDELTGLINRAGFNRLFAEAMAAAADDAGPLALMLIDLDGFKAVNDQCGHLTGDQVLQTIASALHAPYLADCTCARLGGDEFAILVRGRAPDAVTTLAQTLLADLRHEVAVGDGETLAVSGTLGISWFAPGLCERDLLRRADVALYHGKRTQRGTATCYAPALDEKPDRP
ncbi:sensor domain-containing diguanylate cyclase [Sphingomonas sp. CARO-RG-8B-R24-01]|uniref:sensor domain-containing diguanylate cyclase n=1 Tax=Sphingomonas sp. CARO-RG-8B-R24-01 TaxID=2914831 RepID=UPI001F586995|nr:sensor domain-containing diguanylate cyclase [Sphingomonas sp. CARO-RG-8B-R24-01]